MVLRRSVEAFTIQAFFDHQGRHDDSEVTGLSGMVLQPRLATARCRMVEIGMVLACLGMSWAYLQLASGTLDF